MSSLSLSLSLSLSFHIYLAHTYVFTYISAETEREGEREREREKETMMPAASLVTRPQLLQECSRAPRSKRAAWQQDRPSGSGRRCPGSCMYINMDIQKHIYIYTHTDVNVDV